MPLRQKSGKFLVPYRDTTIVLGKGSNQLRFVYTGCGGLVFNFKGETIVTDPYYTAHSLTRTLGKAAAKKENFEKVVKRLSDISVDLSDVSAVLVAHAHYDHLQDLPNLIKYQKRPDMKVIASRSASCTVQHFLEPGNFVNASEVMASGSGHGKWLSAGRFRVLPIQSQHSPNLKCLHLMAGETDCDNFRHWNDPVSPTKIGNWREGETYSFLVDVIGDKDTCRIFIQTSGSPAPWGIPPQSELERKKVDLAFICVANWNTVSGYPFDLLNKIRPGHTVLVHWEDFFRDLYSDKLRKVRFTNTKKLIKKLTRNENYNGIIDLRLKFSMPKPLMLYDVKF